MDSRIQQTLRLWFPESFPLDEILVSDKETLNVFAAYTVNLMTEKAENLKDVFRVIQLLYSKGTLFEKNQIENEYLYLLTKSEWPISLKEHLANMPHDLKELYLKVILENE